MTKKRLYWNQPELVHSFCQICGKRRSCQRLSWLRQELRGMQIEDWTPALGDKARVVETLLDEGGWSYPSSQTVCRFRALDTRTLEQLSDALAELLVAYDEPDQQFG